MKIIENLEEKIKNSLEEMEKNTKRKLEEINKCLKETKGKKREIMCGDHRTT